MSSLLPVDPSNPAVPEPSALRALPTDPAAPTGRSVRLGGTVYPVVLPKLRDPRLHLAAVGVSLQILGQTVLGFNLSIAQILVALLTAASIEFFVTFRRTRSIVWPASALLTGNGISFILRVPGTVHGDWWSLNGWYYYSLVVAVALLSKYFIRFKGQHVFNPSNFALVLAFLLLGSSRVEPLDFWWGPMSWPVLAALVVIVSGGLFITSRLNLLPMALTFWAVFAAFLGVLAFTGHCMVARWHFGAVCDSSFWWVLVTSPEILIFLFFMITDPKTTPEGRVARVVFGALVALVAVLLVAPQQTEFATKVAVLAALVIMCGFRFLVASLCPAPGSELDSLRVFFKTKLASSSYQLASTVGKLLVFSAVFSLTVFVAGSSSRAVPASSFEQSATMARPVVSPSDSVVLTPPSHPPVLAVDQEVYRLNPDLSDAQVQAMSADFSDDLALVSQATLSNNVPLAATASVGSFLRDTTETIAKNDAAGVRFSSTYDFQSMSLRLTYDALNSQSGPQYGVAVDGVEHRRVFDNPASSGVVTDIPVHAVYPLFLRDGHYLLAAQYPL